MTVAVGELIDNRVLVVGAGLIGGSVALAAKAAGMQVFLKDRDVEATEYAANILGIPGYVSGEVDIVVLAVPPTQIPSITNDLNRIHPNSTFIDVTSVKSEVLVDVETVCGQLANYIPTHPMAGKAESGPESASFDLFQNRIWVISPLPISDKARVVQVKKFVESLGAIVVEMGVEQHDALVARTSHTPQVISTALAILTSQMSDSELLVSGSGLQDMTRLAASDSTLWAEILIANRENVIRALADLSNYLNELVSHLNRQDYELIKEFVDKGRSAKARIPGKHGQPHQTFEVISVQIEDRPGALAEIFALAGAALVNIEDVRIDHALGRDIAVIELSVLPEEARRFRDLLRESGWSIRFE